FFTGAVSVDSMPPGDFRSRGPTNSLMSSARIPNALANRRTVDQRGSRSLHSMRATDWTSSPDFSASSAKVQPLRVRKARSLAPKLLEAGMTHVPPLLVSDYTTLYDTVR